MRKFHISISSLAVTISCLILLILLEILKVYFIMPFPGSQQYETLPFAYFLHRNIVWFRLAGWLLLIVSLIPLFNLKKLVPTIITVVLILLYATVFYLFNFKYLADKIFYQPNYIRFTGADKDTTNKSNLIIGIEVNGQAKAYPIQLIGYHHQIRDSIGGKPVLVTYCTVCRTGRVYSPVLEGKPETFRLVGMDHFNAMFEDQTTKSWWRQVNGKCIAGSRKGMQLETLASDQMTLGDWIAAHPNTLILQPDSSFKPRYKSLAGYDEGNVKSALEKKDSLSWKKKSWVIGIEINHQSKAYDWNDLLASTIISDSLNGKAVLLTLEPNHKTFYVLDRQLDGNILQFTYNTNTGKIEDTATQSQWQADGSCIAGSLKGKQLNRIQAYQEFWHSWSYFHENTRRYVQ